MGRGEDRVSFDRRHPDTVEGGRMDPPDGETRDHLLPDPWHSLDLVGGRDEGV